MKYGYLTLILPINFCPKMLSAFTFAAYSQMHFELLLIMDANTMNPDQTNPKDTLANSEEPDEMPQTHHLIKVCTVC